MGSGERLTRAGKTRSPEAKRSIEEFKDFIRPNYGEM